MSEYISDDTRLYKWSSRLGGYVHVFSHSQSTSKAVLIDMYERVKERSKRENEDG